MADPNLMQTFASVDPDLTLKCPYDPAHDKIIAKSFVRHISRCAKNYTGPRMLKCPINARHIIPATEYKFHIMECPDRGFIEAYVAYEQRRSGLCKDNDLHKGCTDLPAYPRPKTPTEDWEQELETDPDSVAYNYSSFPGPPVTQNLTGFHKDIRKNHFKTENDLDSPPEEIPDAGSDDHQSNGSITSAISVKAISKKPLKGRQIAANIFNSTPDGHTHSTNSLPSAPLANTQAPSVKPAPGFQPRPAIGIGRGMTRGNVKYW